MLPAGTQLGHYRVLNLIKRGGMGEVYRAEDMVIPRQVAIKVVQSEPTLYPNSIASQDAARLFNREMTAIARLDHPNILPLIDFAEQSIDESQITYMVMPLRSEGSLTDWLRRKASDDLLPIGLVGEFIRQAASGLGHAHSHGLIHQDVKPSNFLVRLREEQLDHPDLQLADFGIARITGTSKSSTNVRGTLEYMAPEQLEGHAVPASDQYALAIMAYELLTGRVPFTGMPAQVIAQHARAIPPAPSSINPQVPQLLDAVILRALEKDPGRRFPSMAAFSDAYNLALQGQSDSGQNKQNDSSTDHLSSEYVPTKRMRNNAGSYGQNKVNQHWKPASIATVAIIGLVVLILLIGGISIAIARTGHGVVVNPSPQNTIITPQVHTDATSQANGLASQANATATALANVPLPTPTPAPVTFPTLASTYLGRLDHQNTNMQANISLTNIMQKQDSINGYFKVGLPLFGSGPFDGHISSSGSLQFTVTSNDGSDVSINFTGTLASDGLLSGSYTSNKGDSGQWRANTNSSPTVYPTLYNRYAGSYVNNTTGGTGTLIINLSSMSADGNFSGTMSAQGQGTGTITGRVDSNNGISFVFAPPGSISFTFTGTIAANNSLNGMYIATSGATGKWQAAQA
ncbi:MAG: hypothetical protein PVSMB5_26680 [Ktedonobacteraceae bacterium]